MATDVFDVLVDILCPTTDAASTCFQFINEFQAQQGDLQALIFFLFFPTLFIIALVWIIMHHFSKRVGMPRGLSLLIALGVYIYVILQGYYSIALTISRFWLFGLMALGVVWFLLATLFGANSGGKGGALSDSTGIFKKGVRAVTGGRLTNPVERAFERQKIDYNLAILEKQKVEIQALLKAATEGIERDSLNRQLGDITKEIALLQHQQKDLRKFD